MDIFNLRIELKYTEEEISKEITGYIKNNPDFEELEKSVKKMIDIEPENMFYYNLLLKVYTYTENNEKLEETLQQIISVFSGISFSDFKAHIDNKVKGRNGVLSESKLITNLKKGSEHIGFIEHYITWSNNIKEVFITKIISPNLVGNESLFYENYQTHFTNIQQNIPEILDIYSSVGNWCFITMEKVIGETPVINKLSKDDLKNLIETCLNIGKNTHQSDLKWFHDRNNYSEFEIGLSENYLVRSFAHIHKKEKFDLINNWVLKTVKTEGYQNEVIKSITAAVNRLKEVEFHNNIKPNKHYRLVHGSFYHNNLITTLNKIHIVDWAHFNYAPKGCDVALVLRRLPLNEAMEMLKENVEFRKFDSVDIILWAYANIVVSLMINLKPIKNEDPNHLFVPASNIINEYLK